MSIEWKLEKTDIDLNALFNLSYSFDNLKGLLTAVLKNQDTLADKLKNIEEQGKKNTEIINKTIINDRLALILFESDASIYFNLDYMTEVTKQNLITKIYLKNPEAYIENYSNELKYGFLDVLKRKDENNFYSVKQLYSEYIRMRDSIGLNSSKWNNLTDFVHDLEKEKLIIINEKNCEIFIKYNNPIQEEKKIKEKK